MVNRLVPSILPRNQTIGSCVRYILSEGRDRKTGRPKELEPGQERRAEIIGSNRFDYNITDDVSASQAGQDMEALQDRGAHPGPRANDLQHISISWPPKAHMTLDELLGPEQPSNEHMIETAGGILRSLGMERAKAIFVRHHDTPHPHMHIVASRIDPDTGIKFVSQRDYNRERINIQKFARGYELEHQRELERIPDRAREMTRLYRVEPRQPGDESNLAPWLRESEEFQKIKEATGRWFAKDRENVNWYIEHSRKDGIEHQVTYVDVPQQEAERYRVANLPGPEGDEVRSYSRRPEDEFYLPRDIADRRQKIDWQEHERKFERAPDRSLEMLDFNEIADGDTHPEWRRITDGRAHARDLQHPDNFDEFAQARGLGRLSAKESDRVKESHANEKFLRDYQFPDKPDRIPTVEHEHQPADGMPFYSPLGARLINQWADPGELSLQRQQGPPPEPADVPERKGKIRERGGGREMSIFDDGSASGQSGYGGE